MSKFAAGDYVVVEADDTIQTMFKTPKNFEALVIEKMTPDSHEEFYSLLWNGNLVVAPSVRMHLKELFYTYTQEKKNE